MINTDEDALKCDLAETYRIYDYRSLPCKMVATFSCGLRDNSRIKMKLTGTSVTVEQMMLAAIVDNTRMIAWLQSKDGTNGTNRPRSLLNELLGNESGSTDAVTFGSGQEFDAQWRRLTGIEVER